jgi:hypothetical protein
MSVGVHGGVAGIGNSSSSSLTLQQQQQQPLLQVRARTGSGDGSVASRQQLSAGSPVGNFAAGLLPALNNSRRKTLL